MWLIFDDQYKFFLIKLLRLLLGIHLNISFKYLNTLVIDEALKWQERSGGVHSNLSVLLKYTKKIRHFTKCPGKDEKQDCQFFWVLFYNIIFFFVGLKNLNLLNIDWWIGKNNCPNFTSNNFNMQKG